MELCYIATCMRWNLRDTGHVGLSNEKHVILGTYKRASRQSRCSVTSFLNRGEKPSLNVYVMTCKWVVSACAVQWTMFVMRFTNRDLWNARTASHVHEDVSYTVVLSPLRNVYKEKSPDFLLKIKILISADAGPRESTVQVYTYIAQRTTQKFSVCCRH
jgi:hypothetical protein